MDPHRDGDETAVFAADQMPGGRLAHYEILERIGSGGMGTVYKARDTRLRRFVALKLLTPRHRPNDTQRRRFLREARAAAALNHPHIVTIHEIDRTGELDFIVMELICGTSLDRLIPDGGLPLDEALDYAVQIARGLAAAHAAGVIHRDLKPSNVMVSDDGRVKVLDFGLAKLGSESSDDQVDGTVITQEGVVLGSAAYMSPEQALGEAVDARSDVFSFGTLLYQMLTGQRPFRGPHSAAVMYQVHYVDPMPVEQVREGLPEGLRRAVARALAKRPEDRYQTIAELLAELEAAGASCAGEAAASPEIRPVEPPFLGRAAAAAPAAEISAVVAREEELARLEGWLASALAGRGRAGFVTGEAGSGKTALVTELARRAQDVDSELVVAWGNCNAHTGIGDPYLPFREVLRMLSGDVEARWAAGAITREQATRLWHFSPQIARALVDTAPDLIEAFVPGETLLARARAVAPGRPEWLERFEEIVRRGRRAASPGQQPSDVLKEYSELIRSVARHRPLLLVLDDLQWVDAGSADLLFHLGRQIGRDRILILGAYRPADVALGRGGERHPLRAVLHELRRLFGDAEVEVGEAQGRQFVDAFLDTEPNLLGADFRDALWRQTRGHPLFTIEFMRALEQQGGLARDDAGRWIVASELDWQGLPARVEAAVGERVDRLPERLRQVLDVASVEGTEFTAEVVARALAADPYEVVHLLSRELDKRHRLVGARDVRQVGDRRLSRYRFQHILFHQYVYGALDRIERAHLHDKVGGLLEELHEGHTEEVSGQLARHFQEAGRPDKATEYLLQAGGEAVRLSAYGAAAVRFQHGLEMLAQMPESAGRRQRELAFLTALGPALIVLKGYAAPEVEETYQRARELCRELEESPQHFWVLVGLWSFHLVRAEFAEALELARQLLELAESAQESALLVEALYAMGQTVDAAGRHAEAREYLERAAAAALAERDLRPNPVTGHDARVASLSFLALVLWQLGYADQARERSGQATALMRRLDHPFSRVFGLSFQIHLQFFLRDRAAVHEKAAELLALCEEGGFPFWAAFGAVIQGWALATAKSAGGAITARMRHTLDSYRATGARFLQVYFLHLRTEACLALGEVDEARRASEEALEEVERTGERFWEPDVLRLVGEIELAGAGGSHSRAEEWFERARQLARARGARFLELRAAIRIARLWRDQGRGDEARRLVQEVYDGFTEGFDTADLKAARELLDELAAAG